MTVRFRPDWIDHHPDPRRPRKPRRSRRAWLDVRWRTWMVVVTIVVWFLACGVGAFLGVLLLAAIP